MTRRHHKVLWIEHADTISCLAVSAGLIYSGSWDKTIKVWTSSASNPSRCTTTPSTALPRGEGGTVYSASADGRIKAWARGPGKGAAFVQKGVGGAEGCFLQCCGGH
ncbi:hypothetical protein SASPL_133832 [Salvia splendens]|uniref:Uncharacterized protein n=1 Tax=Salvia splendens TaxID=180675 RepID=A0A8X8X5T9_SALSN|nr:hypothetical protein SASPL_133832 [Salvia splendens]